MRPLCITCQNKPAAINYHKAGKTFYRRMCESCARNGGKVKGVPRWHQLGYRQKDHCEKCGHRSKFKEVFNVFHIDGDLNNCRPNNLKTVCANCQRSLHREGQRWRQGDLTPDF